ncbi:glutamate racemase [Hahella ganghwensis]|uniref:glutamate racemase n=1 Tax=Hahella ganghwensis TaxID=286420 RepID=UPI000362FECC|nr:glutamate racemase [Hahella ganghwensis]
MIPHSTELADVLPFLNRPALVLDSGSGGLTVWQEICHLTPLLDTFYLADFAAYPYGLKTEGALVERVSEILATLVPQLQPGVIVVACNTASTIVLEEIRRLYSVPVVGVVPAIKTAAIASQNRRIGLLATPGTVARDYLNNLITLHASDCQVVRVGSNVLVALAEDVLCERHVSAEAIAREIEPVLVAECDQVVLGCTHFPLLKPYLTQLAPQVAWVDSGKAIARRVADLLGNRADPISVGSEPVHIAATTLANLDNQWREGVAKLGFHQAMTLPIGKR